jgi:RNA polymerase sigma factor (sigma-70 family)
VTKNDSAAELSNVNSVTPLVCETFPIPTVGGDTLVTMTSTNDLNLLGEFIRDQSQDAFTALVQRHLNLVYCAALRQVRLPQLAEEVAQSVFTDLARNAARLKPDTILTAWLYAVTRRTAIDVVRGEARRQLREQIALEMNAMNATYDDWTQIEPLLDDAMHALDDTDRTAVLLRFFENKSLREVGETLGTTDDTARKRVNRAVEHLREFFAKRGVTVGASGLAVLISANGVLTAPAGLSTVIAVTALAGTTIFTAATATVGKAIAMTTIQKTLIAAALAAAVGAGIYEASQASTLRAQVQTLEQQQQAPSAEQIEQLQRERDEASRQLGLLRDDNERLSRNTPELLRLRGEMGMLRAQMNDAAKLRAENQQYREQLSEMAKSMATPKKALFNIQRVCTINSAKDLSVAIRRYAKDNNSQYPTNFGQFMGYITNAMDMTPSTIGLSTFELIPGVGSARPVENSPNRILFRERLARQSPDGKWERIYGFTDGSAWPQISDDGNFDDWEKQRTVLPPPNP